MKFLASEKLSAHRYKTPEGYLVCTDAILARTGKQTYRKNEIFDTQDEEEVEIDRPAEEVFNAQTVASFENKPVTVEHPAEDVNASNYKEHAVGFARDIRRGTANGQDVLLGNLVITDGKTIEEIENGEHTELSCGYDCDVSEQDLVQRNIRGNHIALCEHGRAGIARIVDSDENRKAEDEDMVKHAVDKIGRKFTLEEKGGKIVAMNESGRTKKFSSWDEAEKEFSKRGIAIKDDFFDDEVKSRDYVKDAFGYALLTKSGRCVTEARGILSGKNTYGAIPMVFDDQSEAREYARTHHFDEKVYPTAISYRDYSDGLSNFDFRRVGDSCDRVDDRLITLYYIYTAGGTHADESGRLTENPNSYLYFETEKEALKEADRIGRKTGIRCFVGKTKGWSDSGDVPNAKAHEPGMAAMDAEEVELYKVYVDEYGARPQDSYFYVEASDKNEAVRKVEKATQNKVISADVVIGWEARNARSDKNRYLDSEKKYEVHTRDKNGSCRVDIVRATDYIDAVKKARNR